MTTDLPVHPDVIDVVAALIEQEKVRPDQSVRYSLSGVDTALPGGLETQIASGVFVRLSGLSSGRLGIWDGDVTMDIEVFGSSYAATSAAARGIATMLMGYPHHVEMDGKTVILDSAAASAPQEIPWGNPSVRRLEFTARFTYRAS